MQQQQQQQRLCMQQSHKQTLSCMLMRRPVGLPALQLRNVAVYQNTRAGMHVEYVALEDLN